MEKNILPWRNNKNYVFFFIDPSQLNKTK